MVDEPQALAMLRRHGMDEVRVRHSRGVAMFAYRLAARIRRRHPELPLDPVKVKVAALLHDIGRTRDGPHEPNSAAILREEGLDDLADIVMHGSYYEIQKIHGHDDPSLLPSSLEHKIVAYADTRFRLNVVSVAERMAEIVKRRAADREKVESVRLALPRFLALERELMELAG